MTDPIFLGGLAALIASGGSILAALRNDLKKAKTEEEKKKLIQNAVSNMEKDTNESASEEKDEMDEIAELKEKLNEVNLLNAKLLYLNKTFSANELTESQKVKLINAFDEATTVKEVKLVHKTISEAFKTKENKSTKKTQIKESVQGFASAAAGSSTKMDKIVEDGVVSRWQFLAGIKK